MASRFISDAEQLEVWITFLRQQPLPLKVAAVKGSKRSNEQNRLQRKWCNEVAEQLDGWDAETVRGYSKLHFGVPILRAEDDEFCEKYDTIVKGMPYELKIQFMKEPLNLPVTSRMNVSQKTRYLDAMRLHWIAQGVHLAEPEAQE